MAKQSAGLLMYRVRDGRPEVLLVHPGGPFYARKDIGVWTIPKGEYEPHEEPLAAAKREFEEETGIVPAGDMIELEPVRQASGKIVQAWAFEGDCDPAAIRSNTFAMEWPPKSGECASFPEIDRAEWFALDRAHEKILAAQRDFLMQLVRHLGVGS